MKSLGEALFGDRFYLFPEEIQGLLRAAEARGMTPAGYKARQLAVPAHGEYDEWEMARDALRASRTARVDYLAGRNGVFPVMSDRGHYAAEEDSQCPEVLRVEETERALVALFRARLT